MTPEAARYLDKARQCLADAVLYQPLVPRIAGREAYLAAFHAAEALNQRAHWQNHQDTSRPARAVRPHHARWLTCRPGPLRIPWPGLRTEVTRRLRHRHHRPASPPDTLAYLVVELLPAWLFQIKVVQNYTSPLHAGRAVRTSLPPSARRCVNRASPCHPAWLCRADVQRRRSGGHHGGGRPGRSNRDAVLTAVRVVCI